MSEFWGTLAGIGMLALIGVLFCRFLLDMGWLRRETAGRLLRIAGMTLGVGAVYWLFSALLCRTLYNALESAADISRVYCSPSVAAMFDALREPSWIGPVSGLAAYGGHALGALLFGQYVLGGMVLTMLLTGASAYLLDARLTALWGEETARRAVFLLLCLPGALFLFLPGWPPVMLFAASLLFFLLGKRLPRRSYALPGAVYDGLLCLCALFSALITAGAVQGWIG